MAPLLLLQLLVPAPLLLAAPPPPRPGWRLSWAEEFTGPAGSAPNPSHWTVAHNRTHGELEQQLYVSDAVALDGSGNCADDRPPHRHRPRRPPRLSLHLGLAGHRGQGLPRVRPLGGLRPPPRPHSQGHLACALADAALCEGLGERLELLA